MQPVRSRGEVGGQGLRSREGQGERPVRDPRRHPLRGHRFRHSRVRGGLFRGGSIVLCRCGGANRKRGVLGLPPRKDRLVRGDGQMVLDGQRARADFALTPVAKRLINVNPNMISWVGLILALVCGLLFYFSGYYLDGREEFKWLLLLGGIMVLVSGYFDALDGKVAKLAGKAGRKGDYLDHVFDRYADVFIDRKSTR